MKDDLRSREGVPAPDLLRQPEASFEHPEQNTETQNREEENEQDGREMVAAQTAQVAAPVEVPRYVQPEPVKDKFLEKIENTLSARLGSHYKDLADEQKPIFKNAGEKLALFVEDRVKRKKLKPHKIHAEIDRWLSILGKNKWYLRKEGDILMKDITKLVEEEDGAVENAM
jgi:hypothetical protein